MAAKRRYWTRKTAHGACPHCGKPVGIKEFIAKTEAYFDPQAVKRLQYKKEDDECD